jgi:hypothetical protein
MAVKEGGFGSLSFVWSSQTQGLQLVCRPRRQSQGKPARQARFQETLPQCSQLQASVSFMTPYLNSMDSVTGLIGDVGELGKSLFKDYNAATPFPHVALDNFLPFAVVDRVLEEFPGLSKSDNFDDRAQERLKRQVLPERLEPWSRGLFYSFNSKPFLVFLENVTGIKGLIPDPYFLGGGYHEIKSGGYLSMHADFNHHSLMNLERRINVLIYLNEGWTDQFGGQLELWDDRMRERVKSYVPIKNRCVIFNTTSSSMHGNPNPVGHPQGMTRKSIALYYYTSTWNDSKRSHFTMFKGRPGSSDKRDWKLGVLQLIKDITPPVVFRALSKLR